MNRPRRSIIATFAVAALAVGAIGVHAAVDGSPGVRAAIDAEGYFRDYQEEESDQRSIPFLSRVRGQPVYSAGGSQEQSAKGPVGNQRWPGVLDDNTFVEAGTAGQVSTARDPLSTFALDVDTGSYNVGRTLMRSGHRPPSASIRPEEWINAFDYGDPAPDRDLGVTIGQAPLAGGADSDRLVRIGVRARDVVEDRPPVAVTLVVDVSGSMDIRERLGLVRSSLALLAKHLRDDDTIALVSYDDAATPLLEPTPVARTSKILAAIEELKPGNSTNLEAGLRLGYEQAREAYREDAINAVILCSDGVANVGRTGPDDLASMIRTNDSLGIHLVTVGYGMGNYNDDLMEQLADQGDGFYRYVDTFAEAEKVFRDDLAATLTPVARDAKVQVAFDPDVVSSYRLIGYENRAIDDEEFTDPDVDAGEIGAGHDVTALYEVTMVGDAALSDALGTVDLRWKSVAGSAERVQVAIADDDEKTADGTQLAATVADLAQFLKGSESARDRGVSLSSLERRAAELQQRQVDGADELQETIRLAASARP